MATPSYPELNFRKRLYAISSKLTHHELKQLKYLVSEDLPTHLLERVKTSFELFCALEDANKISAENTDLLKVILNYAQRGHLMNSNVSSFQLPSVIRDTVIRCSDRVLTGELLVPIGNGLQLSDFHKLKCFFIKADEPKISYQEMEQMGTALDMFQTLLRRNILTSNNLGLLWDVLMTIGRVDLCQKIEEFYLKPPAHTATQESGQPQESSQPQESGAMAPPTTLPLDPPAPSAATEATSFREDKDKLVFSPPASHQYRSMSSEGSTSMESTESTSLHSTPCSDGNNRILQGGSNLVVGQKRAYQHSEQTEEEQKREREFLEIIERQTQDLNRLAQQVQQLESVATYSNTKFYSMQSKPHGLALVFGNETFEHNKERPRLHLPHREATETDIGCFAKTFDTLNYQVLIYKDYSAKEIKKELIKIISGYHQEYDSIVLCFSSHGESNHFIFGSDGVPLDVYELVSLVQICPALEAKPKMFFVQACRVQPMDQPISHQPDGYPVVIPPNPKADLFIAWATSRLSPAYRSPTHGSWFPVALFKVFVESAPVHSLHTMMLQVTEMVCAIEGKSENDSSVQQCVETVERLRYDVFFHPLPLPK